MNTGIYHSTQEMGRNQFVANRTVLASPGTTTLWAPDPAPNNSKRGATQPGRRNLSDLDDEDRAQR